LHAEEMCAHGEWGIGFEDLLSNLHETSVLLTDAELRAAEELARDLRLSRMGVDALRGLRVEGERKRAVVFTVAYFQTTTDLQRFLAAAFDIPDSYGHDWDALGDAFAAGLARMPHAVKIWGWEKLSERSPDDAHRLLRLLLDAKRERPEAAADVALYTSADGALDPTEALAKLEEDA
jgi:RNAse (barnase) inhibitor barstar